MGWEKKQAGVTLLGHVQRVYHRGEGDWPCPMLLPGKNKRTENWPLAVAQQDHDGLNNNNRKTQWRGGGKGLTEEDAKEHKRKEMGDLTIRAFWRIFGTSLVAQWLRIHLLMRGTRVWSLVQEDPTCRRAIKPVHHNYWACALEPVSHNYWARAS